MTPSLDNRHVAYGNRQVEYDNLLHQEMIGLLSFFEHCRGRLEGARGSTRRLEALEAIVAMIDKLAKLAEQHLGESEPLTDAIVASVAVYDQVQRFRLAAKGSRILALFGGPRPVDPRREQYLTVAEQASTVTAQFLKLFSGRFGSDPTPEQWARTADTFVADLRQTLLAIAD